MDQEVYNSILQNVGYWWGEAEKFLTFFLELADVTLWNHKPEGR